MLTIVNAAIIAMLQPNYHTNSDAVSGYTMTNSNAMLNDAVPISTMLTKSMPPKKKSDAAVLIPQLLCDAVLF